VLGGWLTDNYSWRWIFYINVPVGVLSIVMTQLFIFDPPYITNLGRKIDYWGLGLLAVGIGTLQVVLDKGQEEDWFSSAFITTFAIVAVGSLIVLLIHEMRTEHPVVDLTVFHDRTYATGVFMMTVVGFVLYGSMVLLPVMLQTVLGYSPLEAGIAMAPRGVGAFIMMPITGILTGRFDVRKLLTIGLIVGGSTLMWLGQLNLQAGYWDIFWPQLIQGIGMSLLFVPLTTVTMNNVARERMGNATSLFNLMRNLGGSIGIAATGTMLQRRTQTVAAALGTHVSQYDPTTQTMLQAMKARFIAAGADAARATQQAYAALAGMVHQQASMVTFVEIFRVMGALFILLAPLVLIMRRPRHAAGPAAAH
jgi:DHA2 family multidrug resistance protein